jgi:hypothetical protein
MYEFIQVVHKIMLDLKVFPSHLQKNMYGHKCKLKFDQIRFYTYISAETVS